MLTPANNQSNGPYNKSTQILINRGQRRHRQEIQERTVQLIKCTVIKDAIFMHRMKSEKATQCRRMCTCVS